MFIGLLIGLVNGSNHTKSVSLSNQICMIQPTLTNLHLNEYSEKFNYYPFAVELDRCVGSCNTLNDLYNKILFQTKQNLYLGVFNKNTGINESKILTKDIACKCKSRFDRKKCNSDQW